MPPPSCRNLAIDLAEDALDGRQVLGLARKGAVQVHQMQATGARIQPFGGHGCGVFTESGGLVHITLNQANAVAVLEVDSGDEQRGGDLLASWPSVMARLKKSGLTVNKPAMQRAGLGWAARRKPRQPG